MKTSDNVLFNDLDGACQAVIDENTFSKDVLIETLSNSRGWSSMRLTHRPTGLSVSCYNDDEYEKSFYKTQKTLMVDLKRDIMRHKEKNGKP